MSRTTHKKAKKSGMNRLIRLQNMSEDLPPFLTPFLATNFPFLFPSHFLHYSPIPSTATFPFSSLKGVKQVWHVAGFAVATGVAY